MLRGDLVRAWNVENPVRISDAAPQQPPLEHRGGAPVQVEPALPRRCSAFDPPSPSISTTEACQVRCDSPAQTARASSIEASGWG